MKTIKKKSKIIVAMSGGVDSSVAAALLKKQGYDVIGIFMRFWSETPKNEVLLSDFVNRCCSLEAEKMAQRVSDILKMPFYSINVAAEFKKEVVDYFLAEFESGRTPNPCIACNKEIKFNFLLKKSLELGADFIATGHYARIKRKILNPKSQIPNKFQKLKTNKYKYYLLKAVDKNKDQSYFLYNVTQKQLAHFLFPIGDYLKSEVRNLARKFKLPAANRPESQEICFIADNDIRRFLKERLNLLPGDIADIMGKVIGKHSGLPLFTIGQRHGLGIGGGRPYYVARLDHKENRVIVVSNPNDKNLYKKSLIAKNINWISGKAPKLPFNCQATVRYRHKPEKAAIEAAAGNKIKVNFAAPQRAITPGQSAVFYKGKEVLGGGIIDEALD